MLIKKIHATYLAQQADFGFMCEQVISQIPAGMKIARMVFYRNPRDRLEFTKHSVILEDKIHSLLGKEIPPFSFIAQEPLAGGLLLEVCLIADMPDLQTTYYHYSDIYYVTIQNASCRELVIGGVVADDRDADTFEQASNVFNKINSIFKREGMPIHTIARQWNYIENITGMVAGKQNYHEFNRSRSHFYNSSEWVNGYPAATGIGTVAGGVVIQLEAIQSFSPLISNVPLHNALQVAAHQYSLRVLAGDSGPSGTPKFERARLIEAPDQARLYISGTAAIRGENSMASGCLIEQTRITMENISQLTHKYNENSGFDLFIIYLKRGADYLVVKRYMEENHPATDPVYLYADLCRDDLLIEMEAIKSNDS
jgi:hypothetical protein